ncbi:hypothetical protein TVAG_468010 [Trichomonas vaginalis G3]|uniref:RRM domain-containing protein n=1 Tax=Trichomonas vaginalis (strain ATCC PRA-98 / G3) TaxID=412133 RepID=A2E0P0_TRIV3|nr:hypothetical protein TVAGG3_0073800 [Trichomonas vaginalis G3]EAY13785.1 hypothetical protein TVAG_468010 [Trichomonas vaginalis G3]KAI5542699.1 hypothetical protein TVAGG3_0073800 [Trichomonas vaginalis G3]|eukprot:XP_001326008.1 hypothetical protein [Trichomonas vaginalis G3]
MSEEKTGGFPKTVFVKRLPEDYTMTEVAELAVQYGQIMEMTRMDDGALLIRFEESDSAKGFTDAASGKKGKVLKIRDSQIYVIPKRNRKNSTENANAKQQSKPRK